MKKTLLLGLCLLFSFLCQGQNYWLGLSSDWDADSNWTAGVPTSGSSIEIGPKPFFPVLAHDVEVDFCNIQYTSITLNSYQLKSNRSYILSTAISSTGGKIITHYSERFGNNTVTGAITLEMDKGNLYGNVFNDALTLIANPPTGESCLTCDALYVGWISPDTFKGETTFINKGTQNGLTVGYQSSVSTAYTTVFEKKFTFRNESSVGNAVSRFGDGAMSTTTSFPGKVLFKDEVILEGTHMGSNQPTLNVIHAEFEQEVTVKMTGGTVRFGVTGEVAKPVLFQSNLLLDTPGTAIEFGDASTTTTMSVNSEIAVVSGQMTSGKVRFYKFRSLNTAAQLIQLGGSGLDTIATSHILTTDSTDFAGPVYLRADQVQLNGGRFAGLTTVEQSGAATTGAATGVGINTTNEGGNRFLDSLIIVNRRSGLWQWESSQPDTHSKGIQLTHAALGTGWISLANTGEITLPHVTVSNTTTASASGGIKIGYGADSVFLPSDKQLKTQDFSRGNLELYHFFRQGITGEQSLTLTDSSALRIEASLFEGNLTASSPGLVLISSVFKKFSSFLKTGSFPSSQVSNVTFYDSVAFQHQGSGGEIFFGPLDSQLLKTGGATGDSLVRVMPTVPSEIAVDRNPKRIILKSGFEIQPNADYSAVISEAESSRLLSDNLLPQATPKTPTVAGMERYGNYPVSMYTGLPVIEIPIYTLQVGGISVPLKLTYHASGIKVTDAAGWAGLGWTLQAGGSVTRSVVGKRDDLSDGWMTTPFDEDLQSNPSCANQLDIVKNYYYGAKDSGADLFSFQSPSASGKFVFENGSTTSTKLVPFQKIPIQYSLGSQKFDLTDEQGIQHEFAEREGNDTWHLSVLKGHTDQERVEFNYFNAGSSTVGVATNDTYTIYDTPSNYPYFLPPPSQSSSVGGEVLATKHLSSIVFPTGKITFETDDTKPINDQSAAKSLSKIKIWGYDVNGNYVLIRSVELVHDYFTRSNAIEKDLKLQEVKMLDADGGLVGKYTLDYNTSYTLPSRQSRARDVWDYFNNASSNITLIAPITFDYNPSGIGSSPLTIGTADRSVNEDYAQTWVLNKITFPTGGYTGFEYESNQYFDGTVKKAGGLRIKQISSGTQTGQVAFAKQYIYGTGGSGYGTLNTNLNGNWYQSLQNIQGTTIGPAPDNNCVNYSYRIRTISSTSAFPLTPADGSPVTYPEVTEVELNGSDQNGKTVYTYLDSPLDNFVVLPGTPKNFIKSYQFKRGHLKEKKVYNAANTLLYKQTNFFEDILSTELTPIGMLTHEPIISSYVCGGFSSPCGDYLTGQFTYQYYGFTYGVTKMTYSQEYFYHNGNETDYQKKETGILYDSNHYQATDITTKASGGDVIYEKLVYPQDFPYGSFGSGGESKGWKLLVDQNRYLPVERVKKRWVGGSPSIEVVMEGLLTTYRESNGYAMPSRVLTLEVGEIGALPSGFNYATLSGNNIVPDAHYRERVNIQTYDSHNNIIQVAASDGVARHYDWQTLTPSGTLRFSSLVAETLGYGSSTPLTTAFTYAIPLLGIASRSEPSGRNTIFEYDSYGRLARSKDHDGNIVQQYSYQYASAGGSNYMRTEMPRIAMTSLSGSYTQVQRSRQYFDGLGRPLQTLTELGTPDAGADLLVNTLTYDTHGRDKLTYLPAPSSQMDGSYSAAHGTQAQAFYGDTHPYSETVYEASPLSKVTQQFGAGQAWRTPTPKPVSTAYANVSGIARFKVSSTGTGIDKTAYADTDITTRALTNEQGNQVIEYRDLEGRIVRKDVQESAGNFLTTAYCYDDFGRLAYVIPPELFVWFQTHSSLSESATEYQQWAFGYKYDRFSRLVEKKVPSADPELTVYDVWDRPVWKRNAMQAQAGKWTFFKYDALNRVVLAGERSESRGRAALQTEADGQSVHHEERNTTSPVYYTFTGAYPTVNESDLMHITYFDDYEDWPASGIGFVQGSGYGVNFGYALGLSTGERTRNTDNGNWLNSAHYYDHRARLVQTVGQNFFGHVERSEMAYNFVGDVSKARQTLKDQSGTATTQLTEYDYDHVSRKTAAYQTINTGSREKLATYSYDAIGRLRQKKIMPDGTYTVGGTPATIIRSADPPSNTSDIASQYVLLQPTTSITATSSNTYLAQIGMGGGTTSISGLQTIDYQYHIRGGLLGINLDGSLNPAPNGLEGDLFSYKLDYETIGRYDGNIGKQSWKNVQDNQLRSYTFTYDQSSRLKSATYAGTGSENYSLTAINYDRNGNITGLQRNGKVGGSFGSMDELSYNYSGNRLMRVEDAVSGDHDVDFVNRNSGSDDYDYWNDGSLKKDLNKDITQIDYQTFLGLPKEIQLTGGRWIKMYYDGSGKLLKREFSTGEVWVYTMGLIVKNGQPYQLASPEGRVVYDSTGTWKNEFYHTDHLGNARVSFGANGSALETKDITHFDPTGIVLNGLGQENPTENRFKYQGKESLALFGLNGIADFGARYLDKTIGGRWWAVDPLADVVPSMTPYRYAFNNPVSVTDPTGMLEDDDKKTEIYTDGYGTYKGFTKNIRSDGDYNATGEGDKKGKKSKPSVIQDEKRPMLLPNEYPGLIGGFMVDTREDDDPTKLIDSFLAFLPLKVLQELALFAKINPFSKPQAAINLTKQAAKGGIANSKAMGSAMEQALGMSSSKTAINIGGRTRFPDRLANGLLEESKNVKHLNFTGQLRDYLKYSQDNGLDFMLHTRPSTTFSKPLQKLIDQKIILHNPVPGFK